MLAMKSAGAEHERLHTRAGGRDLVDVGQADGVLDLRFDADPADLETVRLLDLREQQVEGLDVACVGHLGEQDRVEVGACAADDGRDVEIGGVGGPVVDAHNLELLAPPAVLRQGLDDVRAGPPLLRQR